MQKKEEITWKDAEELFATEVIQRVKRERDIWRQLVLILTAVLFSTNLCWMLIWVTVV